MNIRIPPGLARQLRAASLWSGAPIAEIVRRAFRRYHRLSAMPPAYREPPAGPDSTVYRLEDVPAGLPASLVRDVLAWYLSQYDIPTTPTGFRTELRDGIDYIIEDAEDK